MHRAICKRDRNRITEVYILQHLKVVAVPMTVDDAYALFAGISGGLKPAGSLVERFIVNFVYPISRGRGGGAPCAGAFFSIVSVRDLWYY